MPRPGPLRGRVLVRLNDQERAPVEQLAATLPPWNGRPNLSEAVRRLIARATSPRTIQVSQAGADVLAALGERAGLTVEETARLALSWAAQQPDRWLPARKDTR